MKPWANKVEERFTRVFAWITDAEPRIQYPPTAQRRDEELDIRVDRLSKCWASVPIGSLAGTPAVASVVDLAYGTFDFTTDLYDTGGMTLTGIPAVSNRVDVFMRGHDEYEFEWDETTEKLMVHQSDAEIANDTDLSDLGTMGYMVIGSTDGTSYVTATKRAPVHRACGEALVFAIQIETGAEVAAHASNYWTFDLWVRRVVDGVRETTGTKIATFTTSNRKLPAGGSVTIYESETGLTLEDGDQIDLEITETGTATGLDSLALWLQSRRRTR